MSGRQADTRTKTRVVWPTRGVQRRLRHFGRVGDDRARDTERLVKRKNTVDFGVGGGSDATRRRAGRLAGALDIDWRFVSARATSDGAPFRRHVSCYYWRHGSTCSADDQTQRNMFRLRASIGINGGQDGSRAAGGWQERD